MGYLVIQPSDFTAGDVFREDLFVSNIGDHNWEQYRDKSVLVSGCGNLVTPPWAYMLIASRLSGVARSIRYGNDHDNIVIYRSSRKDRNVAGALSPGDSSLA